jgi:hypothetical protein
MRILKIRMRRWGTRKRRKTEEKLKRRLRL